MKSKPLFHIGGAAPCAPGKRFDRVRVEFTVRLYERLLQTYADPPRPARSLILQRRIVHRLDVMTYREQTEYYKQIQRLRVRILA